MNVVPFKIQREDPHAVELTMTDFEILFEVTNNENITITGLAVVLRLDYNYLRQRVYRLIRNDFLDSTPHGNLTLARWKPNTFETE